MNITLMGALIGAGVALLLFVGEYLSVRAGALERTKRTHKKLELDADDRKRIAANVRFCLCIPPAFAAFFWLVWG